MKSLDKCFDNVIHQKRNETVRTMPHGPFIRWDQSLTAAQRRLTRADEV